MKPNKKIAVTGGIGSGKTLFCNILKEMGCEVFSCDEIYHDLLREDEYLNLLNGKFPECFQNGELDKGLLGARIFSDRKDKEILEALAHPLIMQRLLSKMEGTEISFAEVPLLFEGGYERLFDFVVALVRHKEERIQSVINRSGLSEAEIVSRMENQLDPAHLVNKNCLIVENNGSKEDLISKAREILNQIRGVL